MRKEKEKSHKLCLNASGAKFSCGWSLKMQYFHFITPKLVSVFARHARAHRDAGCFYPMFDHTKETLILCCFFTNRHTAMLVI